MTGTLRVSSGAAGTTLPCDHHSQTRQRCANAAGIICLYPMRGEEIPLPLTEPGAPVIWRQAAIPEQSLWDPAPPGCGQDDTASFAWGACFGSVQTAECNVFFLCPPGIHSPGGTESFVDDCMIGVSCFMLLKVPHGCP